MRVISSFAGLAFIVTSLSAQVTATFESQTDIDLHNVSCYFFDMNTSTAHTLSNYSNACGTVIVRSPSSPGQLGFRVDFDPLGANGPTGFSDGDAFGVAP